MNRKDESSLELEAVTAALVPALQFAMLWSRAPSYHPTQALSTTETAGNRRLIVPILFDLSMHSGVLAQQFEHRSKLAIKSKFTSPVQGSCK